MNEYLSVALALFLTNVKRKQEYLFPFFHLRLALTLGSIAQKKKKKAVHVYKLILTSFFFFFFFQRTVVMY